MRGLFVVVLVGCGVQVVDEPAADPPAGEMPPEEMPPQPPPEPPGPTVVTLDGMQAGWRVTTSQLIAGQSPAEHTVISDGSPITLSASLGDLFVAMITDETGNLVRAHAMQARCTLASHRRLDVPSEYATIQSAIDASSPGDTIRVAAGTYSESIKMRPGICLLGNGAKTTVLDANGEGRTLINLEGAAGSIVSGFTIRRTMQTGICSADDGPWHDPFTCAGGWYEAGIFVSPGPVLGWESPMLTAPALITNNVFEGNDLGVMLYFYGIAIVRNNVFVGNRYGLVANHYAGARTLIANNVFLNNTEVAIGSSCAVLDLVDNMIVGSPIGIRYECDCCTGRVLCNLFYGNGSNQNLEVAPRFTIGTNGNVEAEPRFLETGTYHLQTESSAKGAGCHGNKVIQPNSSLPDIGVYGGPLSGWVDL
jgi:hypothetical protein